MLFCVGGWRLYDRNDDVVRCVHCTRCVCCVHCVHSVHLFAGNVVVAVGVVVVAVGVVVVVDNVEKKTKMMMMSTSMIDCSCYGP